MAIIEVNLTLGGYREHWRHSRVPINILQKMPSKFLIGQNPQHIGLQRPTPDAPSIVYSAFSN